MPSTENLNDQAAIDKIKEMASDSRIVMFCTNLGSKPFGACPLAVQKADDDGKIWFFSVKGSDHNQDIKKDPATQLLISDPGSSNYLSLFGKTKLVNDQEKVKELWNPFAKVWFQEGPDDPRLTLLCFEPSEGFYWDTKHGSVVAKLKMAASLITGKTMDDSVDGKLNIK